MRAVSDMFLISTPEMDFATTFALEAGRLAKEKFSLGIKRIWKEDDTEVTEVDIEINRRFIEQVKKNFPGYNVLGEEDSHLHTDSELSWVIDPIDGTSPFIHGIPTFTCCLSLLRDGVPVLGVIYDPVLDRMFYAQKSLGAFLNDTRIHVSDTKTLNRHMVFMNTLTRGNQKLRQLPQKLMAKSSPPICINSIQYYAALACAGQSAGAVYTLPFFWDAAAVYAIGTEAGGIMTDLQGNQQRYDQATDGFILANPTIHKQLLGLVKECLEA